VLLVSCYKLLRSYCPNFVTELKIISVARGGTPWHGGGTVVAALRYKPEDRGIHSR
jgi:hypothetical protein